MSELTHADTAFALFRAIEAGAVGDDLRRFYHPDAVQVEHPSLVLPMGGERSLDAMLAASRRGRALLVDQKYEVSAVHTAGDVVTLQMLWTGRLALKLGVLRPGDTMRAHVAMILTFADGLVVRHETYDCYEPFAEHAA